MNAKIYSIDPEEIREENEYYSPYNALLEKIDKVGGMRPPIAKWYPPHIDPLDELAIDVIDNIDKQLCTLDGEADCITVDLWECIPETLGYDRDLEDGNLLTKAIYLVSTEITRLLAGYWRKKEKYFDIWYVNDIGHICIAISKNLSQVKQPELYSLQNKAFMTEHNIQTMQNLIMPFVTGAVESQVDIENFVAEQIGCTLEISDLLLKSQKDLNLYHFISHGFSLIVYLRCLQLYLHSRLSALEKLCVPQVIEWYVEGESCDDVDFFLSMDSIYNN